MKPYERLREYRKNILKINQDEFARRLCMSRSNVGNIEVGRIELTDRTIKQICSEFGVSEHWIRTGEGEIYCQDDADDDLIAQVAKKYKLDEAGQALLKTFLELPEEYARLLLSFAHRLINAQAAIAEEQKQAAQEQEAYIDAEVEQYRQQLIAERAAKAKSSASPDITVKDA